MSNPLPSCFQCRHARYLRDWVCWREAQVDPATGRLSDHPPLMTCEDMRWWDQHWACGPSGKFWEGREMALVA